MKKYRVGIVGLSRGRGFVDVFAAHPRVEVSALCDLNESLLAELGEAFSLPDSSLHTDYESFLNTDTDIVIIATPIPEHTAHTIAALEAGKHALCEQTVAYTVAECEQVVETVKRTGKQYMMAENYCYFDYVRKWKDLVASGSIGDIYYAEGEYIHEIMDLLVDEKSGTWFWRHERPPIWYCAHTLGPVLTLMDDRIVKACGLTTGFNRAPTYTDHPGFLDFEIGLFKTAKGKVVKILRSQTAARPHMVWYSLYGTKGHLENGRDPLGDNTGLYYSDDSMQTYDSAERMHCTDSDPLAPPEARRGGHGTSEYYLIRDFLDAVEHNVRPPIDAVRSTDLTIPGIVAHESAMKGGAWLDVPLLNW